MTTSSTLTAPATLRHALATAPPPGVEALLPEEFARPFDAFAQAFPSAAMRRVCLEVRLDSQADDVDLSFELNDLGTALLSAGDDGPLPPAYLDDPGWRSVLRYARAAEDPRRTHRAADGSMWPELGPLWIELDGDDGSDVPDPGVFSNAVETAFGHPLCFAHSERPDWHLRSVARVADAFGLTLPDAARASALRCFQTLPEAGFMPYVGLMRRRRTPAVRLCMSGLALGHIAGALRDMGWAGDAAEVGRVLNSIFGSETSAGVTLQVDVWSGIGPRVGVEVTLDRSLQRRGRIRETPWLAALVARGLASREKCDALTRWPGVGTRSDAGVPTRRVNHLKLVFEPERVEAKAYLMWDYWSHERHPYHP